VKVLCCCTTVIATALTIHRPGGAPFSFRPEELERDTQQRHRNCQAGQFEILDADSEEFKTRFDSAKPISTAHAMDKPILITNLINSWPSGSSGQTWTTDWFRDTFVPSGTDNLAGFNGIFAWNFSRATDAFCRAKDLPAVAEVETQKYYAHEARPGCTWMETGGWSPSKFASQASYFDDWAAKGPDGIYLEPNGVILEQFDPMDTGLMYGTPTPSQFAKTAFRQHAFAALGTSHGFHRHHKAWQSQIAGHKSWYLLPPHVLLKEVTDSAPHGFPHEQGVVDKNNMCGFVPTHAEVKDNLHFCVQGEGEVIIVPESWWHATCALDDFCAASGGGFFTNNPHGEL
jgi:hypothetical protein